MGTLIVLAVILAMAAVGYSFYLHHKLTGIKQVIDDLEALRKGQ